MSVSPSSAKAIDRLVVDLASEETVVSEAAIARLAVIGARAVPRLTSLVDDADTAPPVRAAALRALEAVHDDRALDPALRATFDPAPAVSAAAIAVLRGFIRDRRGPAAVDRLTAIAVDRTGSAPSRLDAIRALADLDEATRAPIWKLLQADPDPIVRAEVDPGTKRAPEALVLAAERGLPDDADAVRRLLAAAGGIVALPVLHRVLERISQRETAERPARRGEWRRARATVHLALATRGSRLGLYDLRESLESATEPLPVEFLSALSAVGDASCLEALAAAHHAASDPWWRQHLVRAFQAIATRERLTRRNAVMKKIAQRWPGILGG